MCQTTKVGRARTQIQIVKVIIRLNGKLWFGHNYNYNYIYSALRLDPECKLTHSASSAYIPSRYSLTSLRLPAKPSFGPCGTRKTSILISAFIGAVCYLTLIGLLGIYAPQTIYGDGLTAENLPPATVGDRQASLFVKISPPILTTESQENAFLQFRLFD